METLTTIAERFGLATALLTVVGIGAAYILRRLFDRRDGILTRVGERNLQFIDSLEETHKSLSESTETLAATAGAGTRTLADLVELHESPDSNFSTVRLHRAGVHACDVLEQVVDALDISDTTKNSIDSIRREVTL